MSYNASNRGKIDAIPSLQWLLPPKPMDCVATVVASRVLTPTIKAIELLLDCPDFQFLPGQAVWPYFERDGVRFSKIYSMASAPTCLPYLELCVSRVGWSSAYLHDLQPGDAITFRGPYGLMTLDRLPDRPRVYIAEGSGIAPCKSQIEWLYHHHYAHPLWLIQANPETPQQLPYREYWRSLQATWPAFHYLEATDGLPETLLAHQSLPLGTLDIDICAVGERVFRLEEAVLALGANPRHLRFEQFYGFRSKPL